MVGNIPDPLILLWDSVTGSLNLYNHPIYSPVRVLDVNVHS